MTDTTLIDSAAPSGDGAVVDSAPAGQTLLDGAGGNVGGTGAEGDASPLPGRDRRAMGSSRKATSRKARRTSMRRSRFLRALPLTPR
jgi:hypothetical protein